jgi:hypothetical protein
MGRLRNYELGWIFKEIGFGLREVPSCTEEMYSILQVDNVMRSKLQGAAS